MQKSISVTLQSEVREMTKRTNAFKHNVDTACDHVIPNNQNAIPPPFPRPCSPFPLSSPFAPGPYSPSFPSASPFLPSCPSRPAIKQPLETN